MKDRYYNSDIYGITRDRDYHDEAFGIMDTADTHGTKGWGNEQTNKTNDNMEKNKNYSNDSARNMNDEMKSTMNEMSGRIDYSTSTDCGCGEGPETTAAGNFGDRSKNFDNQNLSGTRAGDPATDKYDTRIDSDYVQDLNDDTMNDIGTVSFVVMEFEGELRDEMDDQYNNDGASSLQEGSEFNTQNSNWGKEKNNDNYNNNIGSDYSKKINTTTPHSNSCSAGIGKSTASNQYNDKKEFGNDNISNQYNENKTPKTGNYSRNSCSAGAGMNNNDNKISSNQYGSQNDSLKNDDYSTGIHNKDKKNTCR